MPRIRQENFRYEAVTLLEDVDISTYDRVGKRATDAQAVLAGSGDIGEFLFIESGSEGDAVTVAYLAGQGGQVQLKLSGSGSKGTHLKVTTEGKIIASATDSGSELTSAEIGIALSDFSDGDSVECDLYRI